MNYINLNIGEGVTLSTFPDGQPHAQIQSSIVNEFWSDNKFLSYVVCSLNNPTKLIQLLEVSNALDCFKSNGVIKHTLVIPYLMGARSDRLLHSGDSFDLQVIANLINSCGFQRVQVFDPHSDVSIALIKNCQEISNKALLEEYALPESVLVCPDAGAAKKTENLLKWNKNRYWASLTK